MTRRFLFTAMLVAGAACASACASSGSTTANGAPAAKSRVNPDLITADELTDPSVSDGDALNAIRRLRPHFLSTRGTISVQNPNAGSTHVSVNGGALQSLSQLSQMRVNEIAEIRYYSPSEAAQKFGTASGSGAVISVKTK